MKRFTGFEHGMGIGGWLTNYKRFNVLPMDKRLDITVGDMEHFESYITPWDVKNIKDMGMDHVRLGFDQIVLEEAPYRYRARIFEIICDFVSECQAQGLGVVLNLHKAIGNYCDIEESVTLFDSEELQNRFIALWQELENCFCDNDGVMFELLNEVRDIDPEKWNKLAVRTVNAIREINKDRKIILGTRAVKVRTTGFNAFESINAPNAGVIDATGLHIDYDILVAPEGAYELQDGYSTDVFLLKLTPATDPSIIDKLIDTIRAEDSGHLVTFAANRNSSDICHEKTDIISYNTYPGWYGYIPGSGSQEEMRSSIRRCHADVVKYYRGKYKDNRPILCSESGVKADYGVRDPRGKAQMTEDHQAEYTKLMLEELFAIPEIAGVAIWQMTDAKTYTRRTSGITVRSYGVNTGGLFDLYRRPKLSADAAREVFTSKSEED